MRRPLAGNHRDMKVEKTMSRLWMLPVLALLAVPMGHAPPALAAGASAMPPGEVIFESSVGDVLFPHDKHVAMGCQLCHHQIRAAELETPHPDYMDSSWIHCRTCHSEEAASGGAFYKCSQCHHAEPTDIADETLSAKVVTHKSCWKCHQSGTGVEASKGCGDCHQKHGNP
jgi:hypothetical protein